MKFTYKAVKPDGRILEGEIDAEAMSGVLAQIASMGLKPISVRPIKKRIFESSLLRGQRITLEDKVFITRYLS